MAGCAARAPPGSEARLSLAAFLLGASVLALPLLTRAGLQGRTALALYVAGLNALLLLLYRPPRYQIAVRACFLGFVFGCGVLLSFSQSSWDHFGWYMCSLSLFHYSEYLVTAVNNPKSLSLDSFLLNHSLEYTVAALSSWVEFTLENLLWPGDALQPHLRRGLRADGVAVLPRPDGGGGDLADPLLRRGVPGVQEAGAHGPALHQGGQGGAMTPGHGASTLRSRTERPPPAAVQDGFS
ncbi:protein-S-isoprenylcysteine O-methyltransferase isoform X2 [Pipistrellus kuhlii]|uniref:protein-S-isoprenylcysteine O-methyltransferase isoform X2 n=1 Tax=Pipistrellus kuhlii TaxID=59472 RepID=UPI001E26E9C4|nr:protein-S-isoprenylcysteine O-methyltransferase isoform X2 [Pipistrellus kuhlii]